MLRLALFIFLWTIITCHGETCTSDRATKLWMAKGFMEYYLTPSSGNDVRIISGGATFSALRKMNYHEEKKTGANFDVEKQTLFDQIDDWRKRRFISDEEARIQKISIEAMQSNHVVKEMALDRGNLDMVYGLNGFLRLNGKYASVWTFRSFKLQDSGSYSTTKRPYIGINGDRKELERISGIDWNALLEGGLSEINATQLNNMMLFLRDDALQNFHTENREFVDRILQEEKRCSDFLPAEAKNVNSQRALLGNVPIRKAFASGYPFTRPPYCCK